MDSQTLRSQQSLSLPTENQQISNSFKSYDSIVKSLLYSLDVSENELVVLHYTETTNSKTKHKDWQHTFWLNKGKGQKTWKNAQILTVYLTSAVTMTWTAMTILCCVEVHIQTHGMNDRSSVTYQRTVFVISLYFLHFIKCFQATDHPKQTHIDSNTYCLLHWHTSSCIN